MEQLQKDKLLESLSVLVKANSYRNDPEKFSEFVLKNESYFPFIDKNKIKGISKDFSKDVSKGSKEQVPIFKPFELNSKN